MWNQFTIKNHSFKTIKQLRKSEQTSNAHDINLVFELDVHTLIVENRCDGPK